LDYLIEESENPPRPLTHERSLGAHFPVSLWYATEP
jgi:hypothetical protein